LKRQQLYTALYFSIAWMSFCYLSGITGHFSALPSGVHQSAQCDRASLAQNYYYGSLNFFYPEVNENRCIDGIVSCELPLTAYLSAVLYKLFSYDEFWFRLLSFCFFSSGMLGLFLWLKTRVHSVVAFLLIILLQSSPILMFYSAGFLPDITALGLALVAWFLFARLFLPHPYLPSYKHWLVKLLFVLSLSLAVATKTTVAIQLLTMLGVVTLSFLPSLKITIHKRKEALILLALSCLIPIAWFFWSRHLSMTHNSQYFMMRVPIPEQWSDYQTAWLIYLANWPQQTFSEPLIYIFAALLLLPLFLKKYISNEIWWIAILNLLGSVAFLFLMIDQFKYHDYYIICLMPAFVINWLALSEAIQKIRPNFWYIKLLIFLVLLKIVSIQYNGGTVNLSERYTPGNYWEQSHINAEVYDSLRIKINRLGLINRQSCVVAGIDASPNNMLYMLHLRGHRISPEHDSTRLTHVIYGANPEYFICNDSLLEMRIKPMVDSMPLLLQHNKIRVFQLFHKK